MKKMIWCSLFFTITIFFSCKKDHEQLAIVQDGASTDTLTAPAINQINTPPPITDSVKAFLATVVSSPESEYYVSGNFDGYDIYATYTEGDIYPSADTIYNAIYTSDSINIDQINLIRETHDMRAYIAVHFLYSDIYNQQLPYYLPHPNLPYNYCEHAEIQLINKQRQNHAGINGVPTPGSPEDDFSFWADTYNSSIKLQITSFTNNIMEGTFEGPISTNSGSTIIVKNGKFRLRMLLVHL
jgi:hypothetical protein